ncbi:MAG: hypothetical protein ACRD2Q_03485 [Terriglobales bacterium]
MADDVILMASSSAVPDNSGIPPVRYIWDAARSIVVAKSGVVQGFLAGQVDERNMPSVTVYYQKCPTCGRTWSAQLSQSAVTRIGKEVFVCKCGIEWPTGRVEWFRLTPRQQRAYFFSEVEVGVLAICTLVPPLFGYFIGDGWRTALKAAVWGFLVGAGFVLVLWGMKLCIVGASRFRTRHVIRRPGTDPMTPVLENPGSRTESFAQAPQTREAESESTVQLRGISTGAVAAFGTHVLFLLSVMIGFSIAMLLTFPFMNDGHYWLWGTGILGTALSAALYLLLTKKVERKQGR